jgi:hypothetical protein
MLFRLLIRQQLQKHFALRVIVRFSETFLEQDQLLPGECTSPISMVDLPDWSEKLFFWAGSVGNPSAQGLRLHGVFRTSHRLESVLRLRTSLAPGKLKHAELMT